ncbi:MAG: hypothetical protein WA746_02525 [Isosphaeraceae bacterium]
MIFDENGAAQASMVPDYYARLGVDPGADPAAIEAALKQQQPVWSVTTPPCSRGGVVTAPGSLPPIRLRHPETGLARV